MGPFSGVYPRPGHHPARALGPLAVGQYVSAHASELHVGAHTLVRWPGAVVAPLVIVIVGGL